MAAKAEANRAELMALLARLNTSLDTGPGAHVAGLPAIAMRPTPEEALALYFVAARLVELQLRLLERDESPIELARQVSITRDVLEGTRMILRAALESVGMSPDEPAHMVSSAPMLRVVNGGRAHTRRRDHDPR